MFEYFNIRSIKSLFTNKLVIIMGKNNTGETSIKVEFQEPGYGDSAVQSNATVSYSSKKKSHSHKALVFKKSDLEKIKAANAD